jgi:hypothetical protein
MSRASDKITAAIAEHWEQSDVDLIRAQGFEIVTVYRMGATRSGGLIYWDAQAAYELDGEGSIARGIDYDAGERVAHPVTA